MRRCTMLPPIRPSPTIPICIAMISYALLLPSGALSNLLRFEQGLLVLRSTVRQITLYFDTWNHSLHSSDVWPRARLD